MIAQYKIQDEVECIIIYETAYYNIYILSFYNINNDETLKQSSKNLKTEILHLKIYMKK